MAQIQYQQSQVLSYLYQSFQGPVATKSLQKTHSTQLIQLESEFREDSHQLLASTVPLPAEWCIG